MEKAKVVFSDKQKERKIPTGIRMLLRRCCNAVLIMEGFEGSAEVDISFVDDVQMHEINLKHRNVDRTTDVLSFPLGENGEYDVDPETGAKMLGDIVISIPKAYAQAEEYGHSFRREMAYLTAHSMLHLLRSRGRRHRGCQNERKGRNRHGTAGSSEIVKLYP